MSNQNTQSIAEHEEVIAFTKKEIADLEADLAKPETRFLPFWNYVLAENGATPSNKEEIRQAWIKDKKRDLYKVRSRLRRSQAALNSMRRELK